MSNFAKKTLMKILDEVWSELFPLLQKGRLKRIFKIEVEKERCEIHDKEGEYIEDSDPDCLKVYSKLYIKDQIKKDPDRYKINIKVLEILKRKKFRLREFELIKNQIRKGIWYT